MPSSRCAARADRVAVHEEVEPLRFHILAAVRVLFADHVDMALQHDDRRVFVSGGGCLADDDIVGSVLPAGKIAFAGERDQIVTDRFCVVRAVRDGAQAFKPGKYLARLKIG